MTACLFLTMTEQHYQTVSWVAREDPWSSNDYFEHSYSFMMHKNACDPNFSSAAHLPWVLVLLP